MKADPAAQRRLLDLQEVDNQLARARQQRLSLPEHQEALGAKSKADQIGDALTAAETQLFDAEAEQAKIERDIAPVRERLARNQATVDGGGVSDSKTLAAMIDELGHMQKRISDLEDAELEVMERVEAATAERDRIAAEKQNLVGILRDAVGRRAAKLKEIEGRIADLEASRQGIAADVPADLLATYDRIASRHQGVGVGLLEGRRCLGCRLEANPSDYATYAAAAPDDVVRCVECDRILVR